MVLKNTNKILYFEITHPRCVIQLQYTFYLTHSLDTFIVYYYIVKVDISHLFLFLSVFLMTLIRA